MPTDGQRVSEQCNCKCIFCSEGRHYGCLRGCPAEPVAEPPAPPPDGKIDVFEVYGKRAEAAGWDFIVYKSLRAALDALDFDLDGLEEDEEVKIVFKRYTQEQMDEVIYE